VRTWWRSIRLGVGARALRRRVTSMHALVTVLLLNAVRWGLAALLALSTATHALDVILT